MGVEMMETLCPACMTSIGKQLDEGDVSVVREMMGHPGWAIWMRNIQALYTSAITALCSAKSMDEVARAQGRIRVLLDIMQAGITMEEVAHE